MSLLEIGTQTWTAYKNPVLFTNQKIEHLRICSYCIFTSNPQINYITEAPRKNRKRLVQGYMIRDQIIIRNTSPLPFSASGLKFLFVHVCKVIV